MSRYVVDASVGMKWFLPEVYAEAARRLLSGEHTLMVPDLFFSEFGNILWKKTRRGEMTEAEAGEILTTLESIALHVRSSHDLLPLAFTIACSSGRTVYDSLYLSLAVHDRVPFVTADERLFNGVSSGPFARDILWVQDLSPAG